MNEIKEKGKTETIKKEWEKKRSREVETRMEER